MNLCELNKFASILIYRVNLRQNFKSFEKIRSDYTVDSSYSLLSKIFPINFNLMSYTQFHNQPL